MPRIAYLSKRYSSEELKNRYLTSRDPIEARRWHLVWKVSIGWTIKNSAIAVGLEYEYSKEIVKKYNSQGEEGIKNLKKTVKTKNGGKQKLLNPQQLEKLIQAIEKRPIDGGIWTGAKVARWIEKEIGVEKVWNQRGWDYLKKSRHSWQMPRPKHYKADKKEQEKFIELFPDRVKELEQKYPNEQIDIWFFDEHRVGLKPIIRKVWAKIGSRPIAIGNHRYEWLYVYAFVKPKTGETLWYLIPRVNTKWLNLVFENFERDRRKEGVRSRALIVEDNAGWHRSKKVNTPEAIDIEYLPAYSPELQPAERLWCLVDEPLVNQYFETIDEIEAVLVERCNVLMNMTDEVRKLTYYHWLSFL
jgi:transposase